MDDKKALLLLSVLWWSLLPIVNFVGDFPLNDDWAYAHNVYHLSERRELEFSNWPAMTLIAQTLWGTLFCKIFGFSFTVLRLSTLTIAWLGGLAGYGLARRLEVNTVLSAFAVLVWWFNPLFFSLSYTFMTDVHFLSVCLICLYFYVRYSEKHDIKWFLWGTLFSILAILIRQTAIFVPLFFMVFWLVQHRFNRSSWLASIVPFVLCAATLGIYTYWRQSVYGLPPSWGSVTSIVKGIFDGYLFKALETRQGVLLVYMGWFLMPLIVLLAWSVMRTVKVYKQLIALFLTLLLCFYCFYWYYCNGEWGNLLLFGVFYNLGLGPKMVIDIHHDINHTFFLSETTFRWLFGVGGVSGGVLLWACLSVLLGWRAFVFSRKQWACVLGGFFAALFCAAYLMLDTIFFDRYILGFNFFIFVSILPFCQYDLWTKRPFVQVLAAIVWLPFAWFAISGTHDYLAWNRARWEGLNYLTDTLKINPNLIDGGFEFNGWHQTAREKNHGRHTTGWWFVDKDDYAITFGDFRNYKPLKIIEYPLWLPPFGVDSIWVMQKPQPKYRDTLYCNAETLDSTGALLVAGDNIHLFGGGHLRTNTRARSGQYSVQMNQENAFAFQFISPNAQTNNEYILSAWVYGEKLERGGLWGETAMAGTSLDSKQVFLSSFHNERDSAGWQFKQFRFVVPSNFPDTAIQSFVWHPHSSTVWVDDVRLIRIYY